MVSKGYFKYIELENKVAAITDYIGNETHIEFPETIDGLVVTGIGGFAFYNSICKRNIRSIKFSKNIAVIGDSAFEDFANLETIDFGQVSIIKYSAFEGCSKLINVVLPESLFRMDGRAFANCIALEKITINSNPIPFSFSWSGNQFEGCRNLRNIVASPKSPAIASIDGVLFNKDITTLLCYPPARPDQGYAIPNTVNYIFSDAFLNCNNLIDVTLPQNLNTIGYRSFKGCRKLKEIVIPIATKTIGKEAFVGCSSLTKVKFLGETTQIEKDAFKECPQISYRNEIKQRTTKKKSKSNWNNIIPVIMAISLVLITPWWPIIALGAWLIIKFIESKK